MAAFQFFINVVLVQCVAQLAGLSAFYTAAFTLDRLGTGQGALDQIDLVEPEETNALPEEQPINSAAISSVSLSRINNDEALLHVLVDVHLDKSALPSPEAALPASGIHLDPLPKTEFAPAEDKRYESASDSFSIDGYIKASELLDKLQADQPQFDFQPIHDTLKGSPEPEEVEQTIAYVRSLREKLTRYIRDTTTGLSRFSQLVFDPPISEENLASQPLWKDELDDAMKRTKDIIDDFINYLYDIKTQLQMVCMEAAQLDIPISKVVLEPAPTFRNDRKLQPVSPVRIQTLSEYAQWLVDFLSNAIPTANELAVKSFPRFRMVRDADGAATLEEERERFTRSVDEYLGFLDDLSAALDRVPDVDQHELKEATRL